MDLTPDATPNATPTPTVTTTPTFTPIAGAIPSQIFFVLRETAQLIEQYSVPINNILSSMVNDDVSFDVSSEAVRPQGLHTSTDGTKVFILDDNVNRGTGIISEYDLGTGWDLSTIAASGVTFNASKNPENPSLAFRPSDIIMDETGDNMYILDDASDNLYQYSLGTAYDLTTVSYTPGDYFDLSANTSKPIIPITVLFGNLGNKLYILNKYNNSIDQYVLPTNYDIKTAVFEKSEVLRVSQTYSMSLNADGSRLFVDIGNAFASYQLTNWEVDTLDRISGYDGTVDGVSRAINLRQADIGEVTPTPTPSATTTITPTPTVTPTVSDTPAVTPTVTPTISDTPAVTPTVTPTISDTPAITPSATVTPTVTPTISDTPAVTPTVTPTISVTPSTTPL